MSIYTLLLRSVFFLLASRALLFISLYDFAGLVPRELMFEGHVTFEQIFQKIVVSQKFFFKISGLKNYVFLQLPRNQYTDFWTFSTTLSSILAELVSWNSPSLKRLEKENLSPSQKIV